MEQISLEFTFKAQIVLNCLFCYLKKRNENTNYYIFVCKSNTVITALLNFL